MIPRNKKRKHETPVGKQSSLGSTPGRNHGASRADGDTLQSQLAIDIEVTRERLHGLDIPQQNSLTALSSLSEAYAAVWHDASEFGQTGKSYFLFEGNAVSWVNGEHDCIPIATRGY